MDIQTNYVAFQDLLEMKIPKSPTNPNDQTPPPAASSFQLNPAAEEWSPANIPEDHRSLFMTFSKGHPLTKPEIVDYFYRIYGDCVEEVYIHKPRGGTGIPEFGKIVFKNGLIPFMILQNRDFVIYRIVDQKTIGLKRYRTTAAAAS